MPELDTLRGMAVLLVLFLHGFVFTYGYKGYSGLDRTFMQISSLGKLGVNLFFVLSGFLITGILLRSRTDPNFFKNFYARRALRILPAYGLVLICLLGVGASWKFVGLSAIFMANLTPLFGVTIFYGPLWSLAVEEHFYLVWPTLAKHLGLSGITLIATLIVLAVPCLRWWYFPSEGLSNYTWFNCDGLAIGALLQILVMKTSDRRLLGLVAILLLAIPVLVVAVVGPSVIVSQSNQMGAALQLPLWNIVFGGVVLAFLLLGTGKFSRCVTIRPLQFIGHISYGLYLVHLLVFPPINRALSKVLPGLLQPSPPLSLIAVGFLTGSAVAILVAWVSREFFEERFLRLKHLFKPIVTAHPTANPAS